MKYEHGWMDARRHNNASVVSDATMVSAHNWDINVLGITRVPSSKHSSPGRTAYSRG